MAIKKTTRKNHSNTTKDVLAFIDVVRDGVRTKRLPRVTAELKKIIHTDNNSSDQPLHDENDLNLILNLVSVCYDMSVNTILTTDKRGNFYEAKKICFCLLSECLGYTSIQIATVFKRHKAQVTRELALFKRMDNKNIIDAAFLVRFKTIKKDFFTQKNIYHENL